MTAKQMTWEEAVLWLRSQPEQVELVMACFYDDPLIEAAERYHKSPEWAAVRDFLPRPPGRALDIGAGRGISSYALAKDGWDVTALEPDKSNIVGAGAIRALADEAGLRIEVVEDAGERLPFADSTFDCVHARQTLHHAKDLNRFCKEASRVLKKGGTFIATREHVISRREDLEGFLKTHPLHHLYGGENAYLLEEYLSAIQNSGIRLTNVLNPFASVINFFPMTKEGLKASVSGMFGVPWPQLIPDVFLRFMGWRSNAPGRVYTFVGRKE